MKYWSGTIVAVVMLTGCTSMVNSVTEELATNLNKSILNQNDLATVRQGAPAYLIMIDGLLQGSPDDADLLITGSRFYDAYSSAFVREPERAQRLSEKSLTYSSRALCRRHKDLCGVDALRFPEFQERVQLIQLSDLDALYAWGSAWAGWIQSRRDDWNAIADIPKVQAIMERVVELDERYDAGRAHLYLGVLNTLLPPAAGGQPQRARAHFESAIELGEGKNLMAKTLYAESYARLVFDRELHDRLLQEVLSAPASSPDLTLVNTLAQEKARELLSGSADYF